MERLVAGIAMCIAFVVMASVFSPAPSHADGSHDGAHGPAAEHDPHSDDPHDDLHSLGAIEHGRYFVKLWATSVGPRYTVLDAGDGSELGVLLSLDQVTRHFPDLELGNLDESPTQLMLAD